MEKSTDNQNIYLFFWQVPAIVAFAAFCGVIFSIKIHIVAPKSLLLVGMFTFA